jgi:hypothetical protein
MIVLLGKRLYRVYREYRVKKRGKLVTLSPPKRFHHRGTEDTEKHREKIEWNHEPHEKHKKENVFEFRAFRAFRGKSSFFLCFSASLREMSFFPSGRRW